MVAGGAVDDFVTELLGGQALEDGAVDRYRLPFNRFGGQCVDLLDLRRFQRNGLLDADRYKAHGVAGAQLAELPQVGGDHGRRADEAAQ